MGGNYTATVEVWEWLSNFFSHFTGCVITCVSWAETSIWIINITLSRPHNIYTFSLHLNGQLLHDCPRTSELMLKDVVKITIVKLPKTWQTLNSELVLKDVVRHNHCKTAKNMTNIKLCAKLVGYNVYDKTMRCHCPYSEICLMR